MPTVPRPNGRSEKGENLRMLVECHRPPTIAVANDILGCALIIHVALGNRVESELLTLSMHRL